MTSTDRNHVSPPHPIVLCLCALLLAVVAAAQGPDEHRVRELTEEELDAAALVEALTPDGAPPAGFKTRSLTPVEPDCAFYREQKARGIAVRPTADDVALPIHFPFDSARITSTAAEQLDEVGRALEDRALASCCFEIQGHTDAIGSEGYNQSLSERRAQSVVDYLAEHYGIDPQRLMIVGYGESRPVADNESDDGRSRNRRVQIKNLGYGNPES